MTAHKPGGGGSSPFVLLGPFTVTFASPGLNGTDPGALICPVAAGTFVVGAWPTMRARFNAGGSYHSYVMFWNDAQDNLAQVGQWDLGNTNDLHSGLLRAQGWSSNVADNGALAVTEDGSLYLNGPSTSVGSCDIYVMTGTA